MGYSVVVNSLNLELLFASSPVPIDRSLRLQVTKHGEHKFRSRNINWTTSRSTSAGVGQPTGTTTNNPIIKDCWTKTDTRSIHCRDHDIKTSIWEITISTKEL